MKPIHLLIAIIFMAFTACNKQAKRQAEAEKIVMPKTKRIIFFILKVFVCLNNYNTNLSSMFYIVHSYT